MEWIGVGGNGMEKNKIGRRVQKGGKKTKKRIFSNSSWFFFFSSLPSIT